MSLTVGRLLLETLEDLEEKQFKRFKKLLSHDLPEGFVALKGKQHESLDIDDTVDALIDAYGSDGSLTVTVHILSSDALLKNELALEVAERGRNASKTEAPWEKAQQHLKEKLLSKYCHLISPTTLERQVPLREIHTELLIIEGRHEEIVTKHEGLPSKRDPSYDSRIKMDQIFADLRSAKGIRTVMTTGISGIGKTITVNKFVLDWIEGICSQSIQFICALPFRELNLIEDNMSLITLIYFFHPEMNTIDVAKLKCLKILFIFDGLDESKLDLNFAKNKVLSAVDKEAPIDALLTNLIKGHLLQDSLIWITSRPAAAHKIPNEYIDRFTAVQGFTNERIKEYFQKATQGDDDLAARIISHIQSVRTLHIMCHIPIFCWISVCVLKDMMRDSGTQTKIPRTLTEMYVHYLLVQICVKNQKYDGCNQINPKKVSDDDKKILLALGKLAFQQLQKVSVFFDEDDVKACGIDVDTAILHSGMCTEIIRIEKGLYKEKIFSFVHLSIQELFAALHILYEFGETNRNLLYSEKSLREKYELPENMSITFGKKEESDSEDCTHFPGLALKQYEDVTVKFRKSHSNYWKKESCNVFTSLSGLHKKALDLMLSSTTGHWDVFVRFLLGLSMGDNLTLLETLWEPKGRNSASFEDIDKQIGLTIRHIKHKIAGDPPPGSVFREDHSPERLISLFHCLSELHHTDPVDEVLNKLNSLSGVSILMARQCSALAYILMMNNQTVFDLKKYNADPEGHERLMPVLKHCKTLRMDNGGIELKTYYALADALKSDNNCITELDLSNNVVPDEGIAAVCNSLESPESQLQILNSDTTKLELLSVSGNDLYDSGVKMLLSGLLNPSCKLQTLCLESCGLTAEVCEDVAAVLSSAGSSLRELDLSSNNLGDVGVQRLCIRLGPNLCELQTLRLFDCSLTEACCPELAAALCSAMSGLRYLDVSHNPLRDCGVQQLCTALKDPSCHLEKLGLSGCDVTESGCGHLVSAISLNRAYLRELDLGFQDRNDPRLKYFASLLDDPSCKLEQVVISQDGEERRTVLLQHACLLTFDDRSMCPMLSLSEDSRAVSCKERPGGATQHPGKFPYPQVLCREGLTAPCYWEVEWKGQACYIGLTAHNMVREETPERMKGIVGYDNTSWSIMCEKNSYQLIHDKQMMNKVFTSVPSQRVGVFLEGSKILFYIVSKDKAELLHEVQSDFAEPLYPGFFLGPNTSVLLC